MSWLTANQLKYKIERNASPSTLQAFHGVFSIDQLPFAVPHYPYFMVVNTQSHNLPGEHWIAVFIDKDKRGEVFDSLALPIAQPLIRWLNRFSRTFTTSHLMYQHPLSSKCGAFVLFYILHRLHDAKCMRNFFTTTPTMNEHYITLYYESLK